MEGLRHALNAVVGFVFGAKKSSNGTISKGDSAQTVVRTTVLKESNRRTLRLIEEENQELITCTSEASMDALKIESGERLFSGETSSHAVIVVGLAVNFRPTTSNRSRRSQN